MAKVVSTVQIAVEVVPDSDGQPCCKRCGWDVDDVQDSPVWHFYHCNGDRRGTLQRSSTVLEGK